MRTGLPAQARVEDELGHGRWGVIPWCNGLGRMLPKRRLPAGTYEIKCRSRRWVADGGERPLWVLDSHIGSAPQRIYQEVRAPAALIYVFVGG
jgi:hypothetical protein